MPERPNYKQEELIQSVDLAEQMLSTAEHGKVHIIGAGKIQPPNVNLIREAQEKSATAIKLLKKKYGVAQLDYTVSYIPDCL